MADFGGTFKGRPNLPPLSATCRQFLPPLLTTKSATPFCHLPPISATPFDHQKGGFCHLPPISATPFDHQKGVRPNLPPVSATCRQFLPSACVRSSASDMADPEEERTPQKSQTSALPGFLRKRVADLAAPFFGGQKEWQKFRFGRAPFWWSKGVKHLEQT